MTTILDYDKLKKDFLNDKTQSFDLEITNSGFKIVFKESDEFKKHWYMLPPDLFRNQTEIAIIRPIGCTNKEAFTHELLHAYLFTQGFKPFSQKNYAHYSKKNKDFRAAFEGSAPDRTIYNAIQHPKMIPLFIGAGFQKENFRTDKDEIQLGLEYEYSLLQNKKPYQDYFINFIRHYSRVNDCPTDKYLPEYSVYVNKLKKFHNELYDIFQRHWDEWVIQDSFDFENIFISLTDELEANYIKNSR